MSSPSPGSAQLNAVAAVSANDVWAVGTAGPDALVEHWNGSSWSIVPTPKPQGSTQAQLLGVTAVSGSDVWAVGFSVNAIAPAGGYATLAEHWNGSSWTIVPTPNPSAPPYEISLNAVAAISANDIWAVGGRGYEGRALLEHWNGSTWSIVAAPPSTVTWFASSRVGVAAVASNDVWAVGDYDSVHWDGTAWNVVQGAQNTSAAAAAGAANVWAVGSYGYYSIYGYYGPVPVAHQWKGTSWVDTKPVVPTYKDAFWGVSARAANDVWAVGYTSSKLTLTEHWDGTSWTVVFSPNASTGYYDYNSLKAVVGIASNDVWAVGYYFDGAGQHTLIEHYAG